MKAPVNDTKRGRERGGRRGTGISKIGEGGVEGRGDEDNVTEKNRRGEKGVEERRWKMM